MSAAQEEAPDLMTLIERQHTQVENLGRALLDKNSEATLAAVSGIVAGVSTGSPLLAAFADSAVRYAFSKSATRRLLEAFAHEQNLQSSRRAQDEAAHTLALQVAEAVEELMGQALIQLVRVQHNIADEKASAWMAELGGIREELESFRKDFQERLGETSIRAAVTVDLQEIMAGGIGVRVRSDGRRSVFIRKQVVRGTGIVVE